MGKQWKQRDTLFSWAPKSLQIVAADMKLKDNLWMESYDKPTQCITKQRHHFVDQGPHSQSYSFSSSHALIWVMDDKESWMPNNWHFELWYWRRLLRIPWAARRWNQSVLRKSTLNIHWEDWCWNWSSDTLPTWLIRKDPDAGKGWGQEEKGLAEDEMVR